MEALAVGGRGGSWQLLACHTCPEFRDATPNDKIRLGVLLGEQGRDCIRAAALLAAAAAAGYILYMHCRDAAPNDKIRIEVLLGEQGWDCSKVAAAAGCILCMHSRMPR
jgi:hypothetical protein